MAHPVDIHVGKRLRLRRTLLGLSQDAIGSATGITFQQVQKYERGANRVGSSRLFEFSKILNVPVSYFFEGYDTIPTPPNTIMGMAEHKTAGFEHERMTSRETLELMRAYYRISDPAVRKRMFELIKSLSDKTDQVAV